jgi:peptidyl-prolyl cis-trans isomerase B (cyclophilin B)
MVVIMRAQLRRWLVGILAALAACNGGTTGGDAGSVSSSDGGAGGAGQGGSGGPTDPAIAMIQAQIDAAAVDRSRAAWRTSLPRPRLAAFTSERRYFWTLITSKGELRLELMPAVAPMHVTSTIYLTLLGFYDTLTFHRIVKGFMAQGGDPLGDGRGSPGYVFSTEIDAAVRHDSRGVLSMANAGAGTEGSQFFITFSAQPTLDGKYSIFGKLVSGLDTLTAIEAAGTVGEGKPDLVTITSARISVE